jgi:hypothetical protein
MSGNAQALQLETAMAIVKTLGELNPPVHVLFVATNGDKGYDSCYHAQFKVWFPLYWSSGLAACLTLIGSMAPFFIGDLLHLGKNVRGRILTYVPQLSYKGCFFSVEWESIEAILHLEPVFTDRTGAGKIRNCYPIALFRLADVVQLFCGHRCAEAVRVKRRR